MVSLIAFLGLGIFGIGKGNPDVILFQDIENGDPILAGRFHADVVAVVFCKPVTQLLQTFGKGREAGLPVFGTAFGIGNANAGIDPGFVDIKATTIEFKDFKGQNR